MRVKRRPVVGFLIGLIIIVLLGYGIYKVVAPSAPPPARAGRGGDGAPQPVGVATAVKATIHITLNALGTVTPLANVTVKTQIAGQLTDVGFQEGQMVKKGDFLAQIDPRPYQLLKQQYEGQLLHDQGLLEQARADLARYQTLLKQDSIARQQADNQVFVVQQYEGTVKTDQALIDNQTLNLAYCRITAPVDGRVGLRQVDPGNYVQTSDTNGIVVITLLHPISVLFSVPEDELPAIQTQMKAGATLETTAFDRANVTKLSTGKVTTLDNTIDTTTGTVRLRAVFDNEDDHLFPNQFVNIQLLVRSLPDTLTVPTAAIQRGAPGAYVYIVNADNTVSVRQIKTGVTDAGMVAVNSGLNVGDRVVIDGSDRLRDGGRVSVPGTDASPAPAGQRPAGERSAGERSGSGDGSRRRNPR